MKIVMILTNGFFPDLRVYKEAKYLESHGYEIEILCWDRDNRYPNNKIEQLGNIKIVRFNVNSEYGSGLKQIFQLLKFKKNCKKYLKNQVVKYDYLHCHDLDGMVVGYLLHKHNDKIIFDMHEFYNTGAYSKIYFIVNIVIRLLQNISYKIIHVNDKQIEKISNKNKKKLVYLPNYPEKSELEMVEHIPSDCLRITYAGYVRHLIPLTNLIKSTEKLDGVKISIHGSGEIWTHIKKLETEYKNAEVTGAFKHEEITKFYANSDLIYIVYNKGDINDETALPTKFFEAIFCEIPVIVSENSLLEETTKKYDIGFSVDGTSIDSIESMIRKIQDNPEILEEKRKNIRKIKENFLWEDIVNNLNKIYK